MADEPARTTHPTCPNCKSRDIVPVCFGLYDDAGLAALRREYGDGGFVLGGCIVGDRDWNWSCKTCGAMFSATGCSTAGATGEELFLRERLQKIAAQLKADGKMPTIDKVLEVMAAVREEYRPKTLAARPESHGRHGKE